MLSLVIPMAGRGSRFHKMGFDQPKPLIDLNGRPFFWWATEAVLRHIDEPVELSYVVLQEHIDQFGIVDTVNSYYPDAEFVVISDVTSGALETAVLGVQVASADTPIIVNDCDQYFESSELQNMINRLHAKEMQGFLCNFKSSEPQFSYAEYGNDGALVRTVEKQVISADAIAGAYAFASKDLLLSHYETYKAECQYDELFISGIFNLMVKEGQHIEGLILDRHISFGVPDEYTAAIPLMPGLPAAGADKRR